MAVTLSTAARNAACDAIVDLLDGGSGDSAGDIAFAETDNTVVCECDFSATAFGSASTGVATANSISQGTVAGSDNPSTIAKAFLRNKADATIITCAVSTSGSDINLSSVSVNDDDTIDISSLTFTVPAS